ncbi:MAG: hypothetical protein WBF23_09770 [Methyloceanibacter sp.]
MSDRNKRRAGAHEKKLEDLLAELPPPDWEEIQSWRKLLRSEANVGAAEQLRRATLPGDSFGSLALLSTFVPSDGLESVLSRLIVAATNSAMDCFSRAAAGDTDTPGREIELNLAVKLSLTAATLGKAFDNHRVCAEDLPVFIDDTVSRVSHRGLGMNTSGGKPGGNAPSSSEGTASNKAPKHTKT